jgi:hypothetical protein
MAHKITSRSPTIRQLHRLRGHKERSHSKGLVARRCTLTVVSEEIEGGFAVGQGGDD